MLRFAWSTLKITAYMGIATALAVLSIWASWN